MTELYNPLNHSIVQACMKADAWHRYEASDFVEALVVALHSELKRCYWNSQQESLENRKDWQLLTGTGFEYRRYFWGECDCDAEYPVHAKNCCEITEHDEWNSRRLEAISDPPKNNSPFEGRSLHFGGKREKEWVKKNPHPPCTCGASASWKPRDYHLETCSPQLPNMKFGEVVINWYKHIGRGMSVNVDWTEKQWREWFDKAMEAVRLFDSCQQLQHHKWRDEDAGRKPFSTDERVQAKDCKYCVQFGANALIWNRQGSRDVKDAS